MWMKLIINRLKDKSGFSFLEAVMTTLFLSVGLWGGVAMFMNATSNSAYSDFRVMATGLANEKIEMIINDKMNQGFDYIDEANYDAENMEAPYTGFSRSVTVTEVDSTDFITPSEGSGYKRVDVTVVWGPEAYETITVSTIVSNYS